MKVEELFKVIDTRFFYPDIHIVDDANSRSVQTFKYLRDGGTYVKEMLNQFGDRTVIPQSVVLGTDEYEIDYIIIEVE